MWPFTAAEKTLLKKMDLNPFYPYTVRDNGKNLILLYLRKQKF